MLKRETKKTIYVASFTVLGLLIGFLAFLFLQYLYLRLFIQDPTAYCFGLSWHDLRQLGSIFFLILVFVTGSWGYIAGKYWWRQIYVLKKSHKTWKNIF